MKTFPILQIIVLKSITVTGLPVCPIFYPTVDIDYEICVAIGHITRVDGDTLCSNMVVNCYRSTASTLNCYDSNMQVRFAIETDLQRNGATHEAYIGICRSPDGVVHCELTAEVNYDTSFKVVLGALNDPSLKPKVPTDNKTRKMCGDCDQYRSWYYKQIELCDNLKQITNNMSKLLTGHRQNRDVKVKVKDYLVCAAAIMAGAAGFWCMLKFVVERVLSGNRIGYDV